MKGVPVVLAFALLLAGVPAPACAQEARVRAAIGAEETPWAGQQVTLDLDLLTDGTSFSDVQFNLPDVEGAFLLRVDSSTIKRTERIDGETWQVIRYPLALFPQAPGRIEVPPIDVRFAVTERFGVPPKAFELATGPVSFEVAWPPGAPAGSLVVSTRDFRVEHAWQGPEGVVKAGDAMSLAVTRRAADISAMLLPPLPVFETEGLGAYPEAPEVADRSERGALTGERTDRVTWVVERPGTYEIPGIRFQWWDPVNERLREHTVPGRTIEAQPAAAPAQRHAVPAPNTRTVAWWGLALVLLAGTAGLVLGAGLRARIAGAFARGGRALRRAWRRILPPRRALLGRINPGPDS